MGARLRSLQRDLLDSLWFTPTVIALAYAALALVLLRADQLLGLDTQGRDAWAVGGADGARGVLFAIAGTTLSVLGVVFSLTIVVLQIASAQFTPRVMRNLTGDRGTQVVLGVFLGTFTYALLVLRAVRSPGENGGGAGFVPVTAVAVAIVLALVSIAFMIYTINHVARSVQVAVIIKRVTHDTLELLDEPLAGEINAPHSPNGVGWSALIEPGEIIAPDSPDRVEWSAPESQERSSRLKGMATSRRLTPGRCWLRLSREVWWCAPSPWSGAFCSPEHRWRPFGQRGSSMRIWRRCFAPPLWSDRSERGSRMSSLGSGS